MSTPRRHSPIKTGFVLREFGCLCGRVGAQAVSSFEHFSGGKKRFDGDVFNL